MKEKYYDIHKIAHDRCLRGFTEDKNITEGGRSRGHPYLQSNRCNVELTPRAIGAAILKGDNQEGGET